MRVIMILLTLFCIECHKNPFERRKFPSKRYRLEDGDGDDQDDVLNPFTFRHSKDNHGKLRKLDDPVDFDYLKTTFQPNTEKKERKATKSFIDAPYKIGFDKKEVEEFRNRQRKRKNDPDAVADGSHKMKNLREKRVKRYIRTKPGQRIKTPSVTIGILGGEPESEKCKEINELEKQLEKYDNVRATFKYNLNGRWDLLVTIQDTRKADYKEESVNLLSLNNLNRLLEKSSLFHFSDSKLLKKFFRFGLKRALVTSDAETDEELIDLNESDHDFSSFSEESEEEEEEIEPQFTEEQWKELEDYLHDLLETRKINP